MTSSASASPYSLRLGNLASDAAAFVVAGMFTPSHQRLAGRLEASLKALQMPYALFEVPAIHRSISAKGVDDPALTKPAFIRHLLGLTGKPILYADCDIVFRSQPTLITQLATGGCDFAIYNWLTSESNDAYLPLGRSAPAAGALDFRRLFKYSHSVDIVAPTQLICSGAVQFWGATSAAEQLLESWQATIAAQPGVPDDVCLDFAFNNRAETNAAQPTTYWLPKSYCRYAWWIFDEPVIDHPEFPASGAGLPSISDPRGRKRDYARVSSARKSPPEIPREAILDTQTGTLFVVRNHRPVPAGQCTHPIWPPAMR